MNKIIPYIKTFIKETDKILSLLCVGISIFGIILVYSATYCNISESAVISRDTRAMIIAVVGGMLIALCVSMIDYELIVRLWPVIGIGCTGLMLLLFVIGVGPEERPDAKTWIVLGNTGLFFQPSELVKIGFIITFSSHLDKVSDSLDDFKTILLLGVHGAIPVILVTLTGDMGSALVFIIMFVAMMFTAGVQLRYFLFGIIGVILAVPLVWKFGLQQLQKDRFLALIHPEEYEDIIYQQNQGLKAIASGGFWGKGLLKGYYTQHELVPEAENDMVFSVAGEEFGLFGCILLLLLFTLITVRIVRNGIKSKNTVASFMCFGMASMIASQVIINIGMCLQLLPVIGITLPFCSAGGSSNLCIHIGIGLMLSVYRYEQERNAVNFRLRNITPFIE